MKTPFIWLGAGRAKKRGVARRGRLLDDAARAGLPVPDGAILLDELFRIFLQEGVVERFGENIVVPDPIWLLEIFYRDVRFPRLRTTAVVSAILADDFDGRLPPEDAPREVDLENADQVATALRKAWSIPVEQNDHRRDVLLLKQVKAETAGRALLLNDESGDEIRVFSGEEEELFHLPQLGRWQRPSLEMLPYARRLQKLLRGLRRTLGKGEWEINWVDDGEICWILRFR